MVANLTGESIVNFAVPWYRSLEPVRRIREDSVAAALAGQSASMTAEMVQDSCRFTSERFLRERTTVPVRSDRHPDFAHPVSVQVAVFPLRELLCKIFKSAGNHQACVRQIETLCYSAGEIERFSHNHFTGSMREVESHVVPRALLDGNTCLARRPSTSGSTLHGCRCWEIRTRRHRRCPMQSVASLLGRKRISTLWSSASATRFSIDNECPS